MSDFEPRRYFDEHPAMYALSVAGAGAAMLAFVLRAVTAQSTRARVRNAILASVTATEVWGLIQLKRGDELAPVKPDDEV
jgi:hypothetical protein